MTRHDGQTLQVTVLAPVPLMTANQRGNWAVKARATRAWRTAARVAGERVKADRFREGDHVHITATIHRSHNRGRYDALNYAPTVKAIVDGIVDAGLIADDSNRYVTGPDLRPGEPREVAQVVLVLTPVDAP